MIPTGVAYAGLMGSLLTGVYHPLEGPVDRSGWILVVFVAASLALGSSWRTGWSLVLPLLMGLAAYVVAYRSDEPLAVIATVIAIPVGLALTAMGMLIGWLARQVGNPQLGAIVLPVALFTVATAPLAEAARESWRLASRPRLPLAQAKRLPLDQYALGSLCEDLSERDRRVLEASARALIWVARHDPNAVVDTRYSSSDEPGEHRETMTVRDLTQNQLGALKEAASLGGRTCDPELELALSRAIG